MQIYFRLLLGWYPLHVVEKALYLQNHQKIYIQIYPFMVSVDLSSFLPLRIKAYQIEH